jgi:hypothetical protein
MRTVWARAHVAACMITLALACGDDPAPAPPPAEPEPSEEVPDLLVPDLLDGRPLPPTAYPEIVAEFREDERRPRSPSDGGGSARLEPVDPVRVGERGAWTITYTVGPHGVAEGGALILQVSPFWGWSDPQPVEPGYPGYTRVETDAPGARLEPSPCGTGCLRLGIEGASLPPGAEVRLHYGADGSGAARVDRFAEADEEFFLRVDGDGDGITAPLANPPTLDVLPGPARSFHVVLPSRARQGDAIFVNVGALDATFNAVPSFTGELRVDAPGIDGLPERISFEPSDRGHRRLEAVAAHTGTLRVTLFWPEAGADPGPEFHSNPLEVTAAGSDPPQRILWVDLHGHTGLSDGTGTPDDYLRYARDFAALDACAITDHDHYGLTFLDRSPDMWNGIQEAVARFNEPGRFVSLLGYEWTSWIFGHRHVVYFEDEGPVFGSVDPESDEPEELWSLLEGRPAITVPHHPGGGPIAIDWEVAPDPVLEPVVEITSVHGTSECLRCPASIYSPVEGAFVRDALGRGYRLGIVGSGDTHDGHPGVGAPENATVGLAAVLAESLDRDAILEALRARRVYATSGPRIVLGFAVSGAGMGEVLRVAGPKLPREIAVSVVGTGTIERLDLVKSGELLLSVAGEGRDSLEIRARDADPIQPGEYVYVRVLQEDGGLAWSSPVFVEVAGTP